MMMTMIFAFGVTLMVREFSHSAQENKRRAARRALHAKPRVIDIDPKEEQWGNSNHEGLSPANHLTHSKADS
jgi:hypothetical protein